MENFNNPATTLSAGSSLSDTISETGIVGLGLSSSDNLELQKSLVKQKETELKEMQEQIESFNQMVKQLSSQRELAVKRLSDMDVRIKDMTSILETERLHVDAKDQELKSKRTQLQTLKNEEDELITELEHSKSDLKITSENLATYQANNSQLISKIADLKQYLVKTTTSMGEIERALELKDTMMLGSICDQPLNPPEPLSVNAILSNGKTTSNSVNNPIGPRSLEASGTIGYDPFASEDPFEGDDPFANDDPFRSEMTSNLALPEDDPFNPSSASASSAAFISAPLDPFASTGRITMDGL